MCKSVRAHIFHFVGEKKRLRITNYDNSPLSLGYFDANKG